jgi:hypothetical protein
MVQAIRLLLYFISGVFIPNVSLPTVRSRGHDRLKSRRR